MFLHKKYKANDPRKQQQARVIGAARPRISYLRTSTCTRVAGGMPSLLAIVSNRADRLNERRRATAVDTGMVRLCCSSWAGCSVLTSVQAR